MKTASIMQPTYLPWLGYFDLTNRSDIFVFLDTVQLDKRSWQQRNRIKTPNSEIMLTVPVLTKGRFNQEIRDVEIDVSQRFEKKHFNSIQLNYKNSKYFKLYISELEEIFFSKINRLADLNIRLIKWLSSKIGIKTTFISSSELDVSGSKTELLINICKKINANHYLSPIGSKSYIEKNNLFYMTHMFYDQNAPMSSLYESLIPVLEKLEVKCLIRIKANLYPNTEILHEHPMHADYSFFHSAAVLSLNTCDGYTKLKDGTKIDSVANRILLFDPGEEHCSTTTTNDPARFNININYLQEKKNIQTSSF